ncbi:hypothetical protein BBJ29_000175 [Phytophthora kernoviae]|uniref:Nucleolar 27S pre-rRNA processing Urb2/Npa2 C-terminal domain-containing protein n=1 Tax=Phytophthora kernoviae TaxID=325452 RepID=A0A421G1A7_9STRA|nr:hypothetical protein BBJ29_000175 [Phytophthora kernoviae]
MTSAKGFAWTATLALVRWQRTRRGYEKDADLLQAGFSLLNPDQSGQFGPQSELSRAERAFNLPWQRITSEVLQFAVFLVTKAKKDDELRPEQTRQGLRLLQLALNAFAVKGSGGDAQLTTLPLNSCNLLLLALAETLEKIKRDGETVQTLQDVKAVFLYLFGLPSERAMTTAANFQMYRPPTNVFADFLKRALTAAFQSLTELRKEEDGRQNNEVERLYVDVAHAALFVFQELQKTQTNKKKVFLAIAKTSLRDMIAYRHELVTLQKQGVAAVGEITALLDRVVVDALFDSEHIRQYDGAMVHSAVWRQGGDNGAPESAEDDLKAKKRRKGRQGTSSGLVSYQKNLFDEFLNFLSDATVNSTLKGSAGGFFEVLVRGFTARIRAAAHSKIEDTKTDLKTSRKRAAIVIATTSTTYSPFKFWSELCAVAYLAYQQQEKVPNNGFLPVLVTLYNALFRALCDCDVYRVTEDTEEREQFQTMEKVLSSFLGLLSVGRHGNTCGNASQASEECQIISSAVLCSPNLVNGCLVPIFELLSVQAVHSYPSNDNESCSEGVVTAACSAVVDLIRAYDSMRLLDEFLRSVFAIQQTPEGLYKLFALSLCEATLRKSFMTLPPGQVDVLWNLFVEQIASYSSTDINDVRNAHGVALVRLLFQTFVQEVHVVPQNRAKVVALVSRTHERLLSPLSKQLTETSGPFSPYQRELFCIFGELLMFDSVLNVATREQTFDVMFEKLEGDRFGSVMEQLLSTETSSPKKKKKSSKMSNSDVNGVTTSYGLGAAGIVNICVYWLRKEDASREGRERVTRLVIEYVIKWKCWEAVNFHLPELMMDASKKECDHFYREVVIAFINESTSGDSEGATKRTVCDASFYEILSLREVAPVSLAAIGTQYVNEVQHGMPGCLLKVHHFFSFLLDFPVTYLKPHECGDLLSVALSLYKAIGASPNSRSGEAEACTKLLAWIQLQFKVVGLEVYTNDAQPLLDQQLRDGARYIVSQLVIDKAVNVALLAEVLGHYLDIRANTFVKELLGNVMSNTTKKQTPHQLAQSLKRAGIAVAGLALCGSKTANLCEEEMEFIGNVVDVVIREKRCKTDNEPLTFEMLNAFLKYQAVLHVRAQRQKHEQKEEGRLLELLVERVGDALAASMKLIVANSAPTDDGELEQAAWSFFTDFCKEYASFRSFVTPLETFGCLLAVALSLVSSESIVASKQEKAALALQALIANANKDEFRLLLATVLMELAASEDSRKLSGLRTLSLILSGDQKLNSSRRQVLNKNKEAILEWSSNLARLYGYMKEHEVQLRKHVVYLLMGFLVGVTRDKLAVRFQQKLRPGVFALLDVCSPYEKEQLYAALDSTGKSLLKTIDTTYKLTHRYVGKV